MLQTLIQTDIHMFNSFRSVFDLESHGMQLIVSLFADAQV